MCFNKEMSGGFAALGLVMSLFVQRKVRFSLYSSVFFWTE